MGDSRIHLVKSENVIASAKTMANLDMPQQILPVRGVGYRFVGQTAER